MPLWHLSPARGVVGHSRYKFLLVEGVVLADQTKSIDYAARHVRFLAAAPSGLVAQVLERVGIILEPEEHP
jgi:mRNA-degrading endonuclease toxin of MazEF toxin-antitoxin module